MFLWYTREFSGTRWWLSGETANGVGSPPVQVGTKALGHTSTSNDIGGHAIRNARSLRALMGIFAKHLLPAVS